MGPQDLGSEDFERLARIAHRYYVDGRTQEEIAREFGLSRPKVQRLLERARWAGVVDIRIATPPWLNLELESRLRAEFRLVDAIVAPRRADPQSQREAVARSAAQLLERRLRDGMIVAVGHGRDTGEVPRFFRPRRRVDCEFASAMGGSPRMDTPTNPNEIGQLLAAASGGRSRSLYAPAYVENAADRERFVQQDAIANTLAGGGPGGHGPGGDRQRRRRLHDGPQRLPLARRDRAPAPPGRRRRHPRQLRRRRRAGHRLAPQRAADRALDR